MTMSTAEDSKKHSSPADRRRQRRSADLRSSYDLPTPSGDPDAWTEEICVERAAMLLGRAIAELWLDRSMTGAR